MRERSLVVLFDIDGTLVTSKGAGRRAVVGAFDRLHKRPDALGGFSFGGMTDRAIMRIGLRAIGAPDTEADIDELISAYLENLEGELSGARVCRPLPGVHLAVDSCLEKGNVATGLGTGNVREGARIKLSAAGLYERFDFGGFGCDGEERSSLIRMGAERGATRLGKDLSDCRVVIVGDTPRDVEAARTIGAVCVGVATGPFEMDALHEAGAEHVFPNLCAEGAIEAIMG